MSSTGTHSGCDQKQKGQSGDRVRRHPFAVSESEKPRDVIDAQCMLMSKTILGPTQKKIVDGYQGPTDSIPQ